MIIKICRKYLLPEIKALLLSKKHLHGGQIWKEIYLAFYKEHDFIQVSGFQRHAYFISLHELEY